MDAKMYCSIAKDSDQQHDETDSQKVVKSKNPRRRKREFYNSIRNQMEFYFGDANLSKDRFLMQLIKEDPFVSLEVFLKFNKIKKLVSSTEDISKALAYSKILELNEDKTKVRRITEIPKDRNADDRTIYVEALPPKADHDWVKNVFGRFGPVAYVSLPKFKVSKKIKEFGFVEFEKQESLQKALNAFKGMGNVICVDTVEPENLVSISSYAKDQEQIKAAEDGETTEERTEKRRHSSEIGDDDSSAAEEPAAKRPKTSSQEESCTDESESDAENSSLKPNIADTDNESIPQKKKKRRRRKKKHQKKSSNLDYDMSELRVLSKIDWKRLRNKYLNMQRKKMGEIKQELKKKRNRTIKCRENAKPKVKKPQSMNFYGAGQDNVEDGNFNAENEVPKTEVHNPALERTPLFKYEPGLIVRIKLLEACVNVKSFKADIKQYPGVKYVDVKEGAIESFVRCETSKHAKNLKKKLSCAEYVCDILSGESEIDYWNKIMRDREMKLNKEVKVPQKRGREKLAKAVSTHIFFNDEE